MNASTNLSQFEFFYITADPKQKRDLKKELQEVCNLKSQRTIYNWIREKFAPDKAQDVMSRFTGIPKDKLYKPIQIIL